MIPECIIFALLSNQRFLKWVSHPTKELDHYWNRYILMHPDEKPYIDEARIILKGILRERTTLTKVEVESLMVRIQRSIRPGRTVMIRRRKWVAAAGIMLIIGIGSMFAYIQLNNREVPFDYASITPAIPGNHDVTLILSDNSTETLSYKDVDLQYDESGGVITGSGKVLEQARPMQEDEKEQFNQIIVPRGRRSSIILADGTRLWLNSGSRAIYPVTFSKKTREIYIEGEAYLEVARDVRRPFHVKTKQMDVRVLGTKFNISHYPEDNISSVVLVEGSVQATTGTKTVLMSPNQIFSHVNQTGEITLKSADVMEYISWKDGWLLCRKENLGSIISKISRYYNIHIEVEDESLKDITISGKLDLKTDFTEIFNVIAATAPVDYEINNGSIRFSLKK